MQVSANHQSTIHTGRLTVGNERRAAINNAANMAAQGVNVLPNAYKLDSSLVEMDFIRRDFLSKLRGDENTEPKSFEQLHSDIMENYKGEERDRHIAALEVAFGFLDPERQEKEVMRLEVKMHFMGDVNDATHRRHIELTFGLKLLEEFVVSGIDEGFALFERLRNELRDNYEGDELRIRLEALQDGFVTAATSFAKLAVSKMMIMAEEFTPVSDNNHPTREQLEKMEKLQMDVDKLLSHIINTFIAALEFLNANGSFLGFFDTMKPDTTGMPSLRDIILR
ncbi:MAG: hypothetical protein FWB80_06410 [Defluviitaleaceae bacterium]|nr:hypothetical protein [Defluviitaleaceae bacterium]